jgi:hypothetical protein
VWQRVTSCVTSVFDTNPRFRAVTCDEDVVGSNWLGTFALLVCLSPLSQQGIQGREEPRILLRRSYFGRDILWAKRKSCCRSCGPWLITKRIHGSALRRCLALTGTSKRSFVHYRDAPIRVSAAGLDMLHHRDASLAAGLSVSPFSLP